MKETYRSWVKRQMEQSIQTEYSLHALIVLFFLFCFLGWCWECGYHLILDHRMVNRGMLYGPWLPIYGVGGVLILVFLRPYSLHPAKLFFMILVLCGSIEYITGWALETIWHTRWWDYRDYTFQIQGRVSLIGLIVFGLGGLGIVYWLGPVMDKKIEQIGQRFGNQVKIMQGILVLIFCIDVIYSLSHPHRGMGISTPLR